MSLTFGSAPFAPQRAGQFESDRLGEQVRYWEPWPRRMRAVIDGETVLDSRRAILLHETGKLPVHYFPLDEVREDLLEPEADGGHRDGLERWSLRVGEKLLADCVSSSPRQSSGEELLPGHVTLDYEIADRWFEEDEPIYAHPRDPYHRVDVRASSRHVEVRDPSGQPLADSRRPKLLFETGNPVRYYIPFADVRIELLESSDTVSECPYKGDGQHWHLNTGNGRIQDAAWSLPHPLPEAITAAEHVCFYPEKVQVVVDGEQIQ